MIRTLIIGGGAAGLYLGSLLHDAVILEQNDECGRKLLLTGGGRCNYTHALSPGDMESHFNGSRNFIRKVLYSHSWEDIVRQLQAFGIEPLIEEDGCVFPEGGNAIDVRDALLSHCRRIVKGRALSICKEDGCFIVNTENEALKAENIVLAAGGRNYPHTGSDGNGYELAGRLSHRIIPPHPALSPIRLSPCLSGAEGVSIPVILSSGKKHAEGDIVITGNGISGPAALNISRWVENGAELKIMFMKNAGEHLKGAGSRRVKNSLPLPDRLLTALFGELSSKRAAELSGKEISFIEQRLSAYTVRGYTGWKGAMSTAGGVCTDEIDPQRMESRIHGNLFFTGDIVDVDAECGGYSLTWAFATAYTVFSAIRAHASDNISKKIPAP